jgi:hypothetical protein
MEADVMENAPEKNEHKIWLIQKVLGNDPRWKNVLYKGTF